MLRKINLGTAVQAVAIGMLLVGIAVVSFSVYTEFQSSSYAVQVDTESSSVNGAFGSVNHHTGVERRSVTEIPESPRD